VGEESLKHFDTSHLEWGGAIFVPTEYLLESMHTEGGREARWGESWFLLVLTSRSRSLFADIRNGLVNYGIPFVDGHIAECIAYFADRLVEQTPFCCDLDGC
jgi:hypothetical protein